MPASSVPEFKVKLLLYFFIWYTPFIFHYKETLLSRKISYTSFTICSGHEQNARNAVIAMVPSHGAEGWNHSNDIESGASFW